MLADSRSAELGVHRAEQFGEHFVSVRRISLAHLVDGGGEEAVAVKDVRVFGEEAEDQPGHEVIHFLAPGFRVPVGVLPQQLDVELVEPAGRFDVESVLADLPDCRDAGERQEITKVIGKLGEVAD